MRIVHIETRANVPWYMARAQEDLGHKATVVIRKEAERTGMLYGDVVLQNRGPPNTLVGKASWNWEMLKRWSLLSEADVIHIHYGVWRDRIVYDMLRTLYPRKIYVAHLHGFEARMGVGLRHLKWVDVIFCSTPDLLKHIPQAEWLPHPFPIPHEPALPSKEGKAIIGHFPTKRERKGTDVIIQTFADLFDIAERHPYDEYRIMSGDDVELWVVENVPHERCLQLIQQCDMVVDQLSDYGMYGMLSVEAMSMGKVVVSSYDPSLYDGCPIIRATNDTFADVLESLLHRRDEWDSIGKDCLHYAKRVHDARKVAARALRKYYEAISRKAKGPAVPAWTKSPKRYAKRIERMRSGYAKQEESLRRAMADLHYDSFIDLGCGFGRISKLLLGKGADGVGVDVNLDYLKAARKYLGAGYQVVQADIRFLPFKDRSADLVGAFEVLMHLPPEGAASALDGMSRVGRKYIVHLDWYEDFAVGVRILHNWVHDYPLIHSRSGHSLKMAAVEGKPQGIFIAGKGSEAVP